MVSEELALRRPKVSKQTLILEAEGQSQAIERVVEARAKEIQLVNESAEKYFNGKHKRS